ncbi:SDR family NAD(P)-dependent oxidoreductase [Saccharothrix longispora]|uniref:NAD(P)-dependent dehydrogenase (Short-subunit alcohol dehydrogenase family) n=1 Tax=Saccharothrix longispora TaxID=33920 RepID=A0ABU1PWK6_9PSEU|nr:SDR family oxidoreductase [Saccharothrix longispora]MDR6594534.1 NAD(P)-dependent dehydrogenase (short-subunit alcohol dehydrogenase family) [Saccharothrix longispora]
MRKGPDPADARQGGGNAGVKSFQGQAACVAARHGVVGFTRAAALDHAAAGVRVNAIRPVASADIEKRP